MASAETSIEQSIEQNFGYQALFATAFVVGLAGLALLHWSVREPRHDPLGAGQLQPEA